MGRFRFLIFDSGPLISITMSGMVGVLEKLKESFDGSFVITPKVKFEVVDRPLGIEKYKLESIQLRNLIEKGVLRISSDFVNNQKLDKETKKIIKLTSSVFRREIDGKKIELIHEGEASCLAFSNLCNAENIIVIDERTTRLLFESPESLLSILERKLHSKISVDRGVLKKLDEYNFIRSSELLAVAYKKDMLGIRKTPELLEALLYAVKFNGTSISKKEIEVIKKSLTK